ncbi:MAG: heme-binding protein [Gammaproteobacteria bacterium]|nr:heme-binding protein [Gammaproteobacteria bacterium]
MNIRTVIAGLCVFATASAGAADFIEQPQLTLDGARHVARVATDYAREHQAPGAAIAVVDATGNLVYLERLDGTFPAAPTIAIGKARTAASFRKPTRVLEDIVNKGRFAMLDLSAVTAFTPLQGGVPIERGDRIVGAIGVSGAASAQQDDEIASAAAAAFALARAEQADTVIHLPRQQVEAAFRHDANLISSENFRVNASRRDGPGDAEVHLDDTDIFYVLDGSATFVTGGELVAPRPIATGELRGSAIRGGESIRLARGDVITIPRGVPHWFSQVRAPFTYYVVKSRARS